MALSRLENFLKNSLGNTLYVDPTEIDSTDAITNQGNSQTKPFKTIQRALIEAARFSFAEGKNNDRYNRVVIIVSPGTHYVDNRPGLIAYDDAGTSSVLYRSRFGASGLVLSPFNLNSNFDITTVDNELYKLNSVFGGVIVPRGVSLVGKDVKKTKIIPKYVPDPTNSEIESSAIFRLTGGSYISNLTILDADSAGSAFKNYEPLLYSPKFSHHKLTAFEYVDGINPIRIKDSYNDFYTTLTDLDNYYVKVSDVYDSGTARPVEPDYPSGTIDLQKRVEEYRIISTTSDSVGISSIRSGNGVTGTTVITVETVDPLPDIAIDAPITVTGVSTSVYNGTFVVTGVTSETKFTYSVPSIPNVIVPVITNASVTLEVDSIEFNGAEISNVNKRSVYGMNGAHFDGNKISGSKSASVTSFLGTGLQKDDNAFVNYNAVSRSYEGSEAVDNLHTTASAVYKPSYSSYHVKASNGSVVNVETSHAVGYTNQFVSESGGQLYLSSGKSTYGENAFLADGFKDTALGVDNAGYITHIITPQETSFKNLKIDYLPIDISKTISIGNSTRLYLFNEKNVGKIPQYASDGFKFGASVDEKIKVILNINSVETEVSSRCTMQSNTGVTTYSGKKIFTINQSIAGINSIASNTVTFNKNHEFVEGESVRLISDNGELPSQIKNDEVYYAITSGLGSDAIRLAKNLNDALAGNALELSNSGGRIKVVSAVSDKIPGDLGHPIQYDYQNKQWYVSVSNIASDNQIYSTLVSYGTTALGQNTPKTFFERDYNTRNVEDSLYKFRYVIPAGISSARRPIDGYVLQETSTTTSNSSSEITAATITNINQQKNFRFITDAIWGSNTATIVTEKPHDLTVGSVVNVQNLSSTGNATGIGNSGFNGVYTVTGVTSERAFTYALSDNPGTRTSDPNVRLASNLPFFSRKQYAKNFYVYRVREFKKHIPGEQDGVYHLVCLDGTVAPEISPFNNTKFSQPIENLFPQIDRDNLISDPPAAESFVRKEQIGKVVVNDPKNSITKKTVQNFLIENGVGIGITSIQTDSYTGTSHTVFLDKQHNLNQILSVGISSIGSGYGSGSAGTLYGAKLVGIGTTTGSGAIANVAVSAAGTITSVTITHGGGGYQLGQAFSVVGVATTGAFVAGIVTVTAINSGVGEVIQIAGIRSDAYQQYNDQFRVISVPDSRSISFISTSIIAATGVAGTSVAVGAALSSSYLAVVGKSIGITTITYDQVTGIATVGTGLTAHGLLISQKVKIVGTASTFFNNEFLIKEVVGLTTFVINPGVSTNSAPVISSGEFVFRGGYSSNNGNIFALNENVGSRMAPIYVGVTTTLSAGISSSSTAISITNPTGSGLRLGDYIVVDEELMRITSNTIDTVFRGALGTISKNHDAGAIVRKVKVIPVELRSSSHVTASDHTFQSVGFGHGNYSVALPNRQTSELTKDQRKLGQGTKKSGGQIHYTGINDLGEYFISDKRYAATSSKEELFDSPIVSVAGIEDTYDTHTFDEIRADNSIIVNGGPNKNTLSRFDGPVLLTNKLTSISNEGIEVPSLSIHGDAKIARRITVGISTPIVAGGAGDITLTANPSDRGHLGWVFTQQNSWRRFGLVSKETDLMVVSVDRLGIGTTSASDRLNVIGNVTIAGVTTIRSGIGSDQAELVINANTTTAAIQNAPSGTELHITGDNNSVTRIAQDSFGTGAYPAFTGRAARGTLASPSALQRDDILVQFAGRGYRTTNYGTDSASRLSFRAAQNYTDSASGTDMTIELAGIGTNVAREVVRVGAGGSVGIGTTNMTSTLHVVGTARISGILTSTTLIGTRLGVGTPAVRSSTYGFTTSFPSVDVVGDLRVGVGNTQGIILTAPNGTLFRLIVDNSGAISAASTEVLT